MTAPPAIAEETTTLHPARDERLIPYTLIAVGGLAGALITGQPALVALALPFALALAIGLRRAAPLEVKTRITLDTDQVLEGDRVTGRIELRWDGRHEADLILDRLRGVGTADASGTLSWTLPAGTGSAEIPLDLRADRWGRHSIGEMWLRVRAPLSLVCWTGRVAIAPTLRVLPERERLNRLLDPAESHAVLGAHLSRSYGNGHDFAEVRPYTPGDRLRDLNWRATGRHLRPFVNQHHPERAGDVVIALDVFADGSYGSTEALARAARAAWALASIHLQANDRVGLAGLGGRTRWLPPASGRRAKYRLLEMLLGIGGELAIAASSHGDHTRIAVPPAALVVALTPLHDRRTLDTLQAWRARGRSVVAVVIDTSDLLGDPESPAEALARRLWAMEIERRRRQLAVAGIHSVTVGDDGPIAPVVSALRRARRAPSIRSGR